MTHIKVNNDASQPAILNLIEHEIFRGISWLLKHHILLSDALCLISGTLTNGRSF